MSHASYISTEDEIRLDNLTACELQHLLTDALGRLTTSARGAAAGAIARALLDSNLSAEWWASRDAMALRIEACREILRQPEPTKVWFAVCDVAAHDGHITSRAATDAFAADNQSGWTYQSVTGAHGTVLYEGPSREDAVLALDKWLECDAPKAGTYCYAHNPTGQS